MMQQYLDWFKPTSDQAEEKYQLFEHRGKLDASCYDLNNIYPFKVFTHRGLDTITFAPITIFYGGNGSGKSTLLNVIAEKLELHRSAPFNRTPFYEDYLERCQYELTYGQHVPCESCIITSDEVFDFLLDTRRINEGVDHRRDELFNEYQDFRKHSENFRMKSLDDYEELKRRNEARHSTQSAYSSRRLVKNVPGLSNGESAYHYFTGKIRENALYLLDEPENSLSAKLQVELAKFLEESVRFYDCQLIISTHSPFLLAMKGARIYDLDHIPMVERSWTALENVQVYRDFFEKHRDEF